MRSKILVVLLSMVATGCAGGGFSEGGGDPGSVRMLVNITPNLTQAYWDGLVKPFEDANGVDVKIEAPTGKNVSDTLQQQLAAGSAPDVVETLMADRTLAPQLLELTNESWVRGTPLVEQAAIDGKIYTVGVGEQAQSLVFYNKDAFAKAGISALPRTYDEFSLAMPKLKSAGYLPLQTAGDFVTGLQVLQMSDPSLAQTHPTWHRDVTAKKVTVGQSMLPYLDVYRKWLDVGFIDKNALGLKYADAQQSFLDGRSAMFVMGSWFTASVTKAAPKFEVGVFPAPVRTGQASPGPQGATMAAPYMILKATKNEDLAKKLVRWLVTDPAAVASQLQQDGNFRSGAQRKLTPLETAVQQILDTAPARVAQGEGYGDATLPRGFNNAWNTEVQGLYIGRSPQEVAGSVDRWVEAHS